MKYLRPYAARMTAGFIIKTIGTLVELVLPWILALIIDDVAPRGDFVPIALWGGVMLLCSCVGIVGNVIANRMAARVARDTTRAVRHDLFVKTAALSGRQADRLTASSLESRLTSDTYNLHGMIGMMQRMGVRAPILLLGGIIVTLSLEPVLALVLIGILPFIGLLVYAVTKKGMPRYSALQSALDRLVRTVRENITGIRVIKAFAREDDERARFEAVNADVVDCETKAGMTMAVTTPGMNLLLNLGLTAVVLVGAFLVDGSASTPGKIIAFLTYFTIILNAMLMITRIFTMLSRASVSAGRIAEVLSSPEDMPLKPCGEEAPVGAPHIEFRGVGFAYHGKARAVSGISFSLERGQTLGIIGATGSGKSTVAALLMRLYDAQSGGVYIDGRDVRSIPPDELYRKFGVVFQHDALFADSIAQNIDLGRGLDRAELERAAERAQAGEFISGLADGMEHELSQKGTNLSGGQKQRVLLARALAGKPEILVLDDSSSALDYKTDARLRRALREDFAGVTKIIAAQRVSSVARADLILVLDGGKMLGCGTHEQLLSSCELYRETARLQMGVDELA